LAATHTKAQLVRAPDPADNTLSATYHRRLRNGLSVDLGPVPGEIALWQITAPAAELCDRLLKLQLQALPGDSASIRCRKGCDTCCHFLVGLTPPEAAALDRWICQLPERLQRVLRQRLDDAAAPLRTLLAKRLGREGTVRTRLVELLRLCRQLPPTPCPFLHEGLCSIYLQRPLACREHVSIEGGPGCQGGAARPIQISTLRALLGASARMENRSEEVIPLPLLGSWALRNRTRCNQRISTRKFLDALVDALDAQMPGHWVSDGPES
jgi:Fe-S-cluster containining protein